MSVAARPALLRRRPRALPEAVSPDVAQARATTRRVATTFAIACGLLPAAIRDDVYLLYLVFRTLDDLVDQGRAEASDRIEATAAWAELRPGARTPEVRVLERLAARHPLPRPAIADFCAGMRQDLAAEPLLTEDDVDEYCYRVAGTVGVVMASLLGIRDPVRAHPAAAALGMAMQRTNILRDIDEDMVAGRVYVARETVAVHGSLHPGHRAALVRDQIARAEALYVQGVAGLSQLQQGRRAVAAAAAMYREILREIERDGYGASPGRAVVSRRRKLTVAVRTVLQA